MKKSFAILSVIIGLLIISTKGFATLTLKINNKVQADLTLEVGCTGTDMFFIGSVVNNPPPLPYSYPTPRWTGSGAAYLSDVNADFVTFNCPIPGDYEITYSAIKSGITYSITQTIRVLAKDILTLDFPTVSPYNICEGSSVSLQASGTTNYYWEREKDGNTDAIGSTATLEETPPTYGNWTYRVYGWNDGCATDPDHIEFEIDVDEAPTVNANGPYSTCSGTGVALSGSIGGSATSAQWIGGAGTFTPDRNTLNATYLPDASEASTDVTLTLRTDDPPGVCSYAESNATVTVYSLPTVTLAPFADVCVDAAPFALSGGSPAGGTYSGPGVSGGNFDPSTAGVGTHTITYTYTDGNGCTNNATNTITVNALPIVTLGAFADVCVDAAPFALSGGSPAGGTYSGPGVSGGNFDPSAAGTGTHTITYVYTDANGCSNSATNTITVNALPVVTLDPFADVCVDAAPFALSGGNPAGGTYSGPGVSGGNFNPATAGVGTHTITYTYTDGNGCSNNATNTITVNALPNVTLDPFADVCIDAAPFALSGGNPTGGTYSGPGVSGGNFDPSVASVGTHTITYVYTNGSGCTNSATNTITVNALPVVTLDPFADVCLNAPAFALSGGSPNGGTYSGPGVSGNNFDPSVAGTGTHTITYIYTDANGCSNSATNTITVNALPVVTLNPFADVCVDAPAFALSGGNPAGGTYSGPGVSGGNFDPSAAGVGTHTITYIYTDANGCSNSATNTITVNALPNVTLDPFADVCIDAAPFALSGGNPAGGTYSGTGVSGGNFDPSVAGIGTFTITYIYTDGAGCTNSANNTITVNPLPAKYNVTGGGSYCYGGVGTNVGLDGSDNGITYTLYLDGAPTTTTASGNGSTMDFGPQTEGTYTVYAQNDLTGCEIQMDGSAVIAEIPEITGNTIATNQTICYNSIPAQLTGPIPGGGTGSYSYRWQKSTTGATGPFSNITGATAQNYTPGPLTQNTWYRRLVTSGSC
ncbi:MAG: hypothetical protein H6550_16645, partial [Chitinophagales bacterium]|nr:hypothetical protein [Chitinophagales bacterium]